MAGFLSREKQIHPAFQLIPSLKKHTQRELFVMVDIPWCFFFCSFERPCLNCLILTAVLSSEVEETLEELEYCSSKGLWTQQATQADRRLSDSPVLQKQMLLFTVPNSRIHGLLLEKLKSWWQSMKGDKRGKCFSFVCFFLKKNRANSRTVHTWYLYIYLLVSVTILVSVKATH